MKVCVVIPVLNEEEHIAQVVTDVRRFGFEVVVVDDGSKDSSGELARAHGAHVLRHPTRLGKGASLRDGFQYAVSKDFDAIIAMDGDGQHSPEDLSIFVKKFEEDPQCGIINGSRMSSCANMPKVRLYTNRLMSALISWVCRQRIPDTQCGFRLIRADVLGRVTLRSTGFQIESEILIEAARSGFKIETVPVQTIYSDEKSNINPCVDTLRFVIFFMKQLFRP